MPKFGWRLALCLVCTLLGAFSVRGQEKLSSLVEGRVTFTLPSAWSVKRHVNTKTQGNAQLDFSTLNENERAPMANLSANVVAEQITVRHLSDGVYKNGFEGLAVLSDTFDGENWRTMVWTAKSEKPFLALQRFGVVNRVAVEVFVLFHLPASGDMKPAEKVVADFNALCESLKVDGQTKFENKIKFEKLSEKLEAKK